MCIHPPKNVYGYIPPRSNIILHTSTENHKMKAVRSTHRKSMVLVHSKVLGRRQPLASQLQGCCPSIGDKLLQQERPGVKDSVPLAFQTAMEVNNREGCPLLIS